MSSLRHFLLATGALAPLWSGGAAQAQDMSDQDQSIVVTAQRTNRTLRDEASSVAVLTGADIDRAPGMFSTDDLLSRIPNVVTDRPGNTAPAIRGLDGTGPAVGANAFFAGTRPRVAFQLDGRTLTFNEVTYLDALLWDVQQVEVYRGPQSTLQGRNAIGGMVAIKTIDPSFDWSGHARAVIGGDRTRQLSAAVGGPIVPDILAFRVAADYREEDFFVRFAPYTAREEGISAETRRIDDPSQQRSFSLRGKLLFTPTPDVRALITLSHTNGFAPQTGDVTRPFAAHAPAFPDQPRFQTRADVGIADMSVALSDALTLSAFATASDFKVLRFADLGDGNAEINGSEYTFEPRLRFRTADESLSGFIAGYGFFARQNEAIDLFGNGLFRDTTDTYAAFGEITWRAAPKVELTLGARYESETRDRTGGAGPFAIDFHETFAAFLPRATVTVHASDDVTFGATLGRGYNAGGAGFAFNPPFPSFVYGKETVTNYEGFLRSSLLGDRLRLRANIFFNDYHGLQLPFDVNPDPAVSAPVIRNAERATTYGAEIESRLRAASGIDLFFNAGLLGTRVNRYDDPTVAGNDLPRSPAFSFTTGAVLTPLAGLDLSFDLRYTDAYYSDVFNDARGKTDPYAIANVQLSYRTGPVRLFASVTNLFDSTDVLQLSPGATRADDIATISRPRRLTAGVEFGF
jgi:outer membrane receptor protein involved in Fe transport